jgi:uncharacterized damage-inducible protein DinB
MSEPFPEPTTPASSRTEVFLRYLDYFRARLADKLGALPAAELTRSRLPSGWTPLELAKHLRYVELRWLEWGFEGRAVADPWADNQDGRWHIGPDETLDSLLDDLLAQAARSRAIIESHDLSDRGQPGQRWAQGADPATLERVLFHLLQEYARHLGHLDIVVEIATGEAEELFLAERAVVQPPVPARDRGGPERPGISRGDTRRCVSRPSPRRSSSRTRRAPRSRCAARSPAAGRPAASWRPPRRPACRWRSGHPGAA